MTETIAINERDVRIDCYVTGTSWSMWAVHLPTGLEVGPIRGHGSQREARRQLFEALREMLVRLEG